MTTLEGNKLICEFMNLKRYNETGHPYEYGYYHQKWGYLMPAVEKIEGLLSGDEKYSCRIQDNECLFYHFTKQLSERHGGYMKLICSHKSDSKMDATWQTVIQFIQWFNTQTPTPCPHRQRG